MKRKAGTQITGDWKRLKIDHGTNSDAVAVSIQPVFLSFHHPVATYPTTPQREEVGVRLTESARRENPVPGKTIGNVLNSALSEHVGVSTPRNINAFVQDFCFDSVNTAESKQKSRTNELTGFHGSPSGVLSGRNERSEISHNSRLRSVLFPSASATMEHAENNYLESLRESYQRYANDYVNAYRAERARLDQCSSIEMLPRTVNRHVEAPLDQFPRAEVITSASIPQNRQNNFWFETSNESEHDGTQSHMGTIAVEEEEITDRQQQRQQFSVEDCNIHNVADTPCNRDSSLAFQNVQQANAAAEHTETEGRFSFFNRRRRRSLGFRCSLYMAKKFHNIISPKVWLLLLLLTFSAIVSMVLTFIIVSVVNSGMLNTITISNSMKSIGDSFQKIYQIVEPGRVCWGDSFHDLNDNIKCRFWKPCPIGGYCRNGQIFHCMPGYQLNAWGCKMNPSIKSNIDKIAQYLEKKTISYICDGDENPALDLITLEGLVPSVKDVTIITSLLVQGVFSDTFSGSILNNSLKLTSFKIEKISLPLRCTLKRGIWSLVKRIIYSFCAKETFIASLLLFFVFLIDHRRQQRYFRNKHKIQMINAIYKNLLIHTREVSSDPVPLCDLEVNALNELGFLAAATKIRDKVLRYTRAAVMEKLRNDARVRIVSTNIRGQLYPTSLVWLSADTRNRAYQPLPLPRRPRTLFFRWT